MTSNLFHRFVQALQTNATASKRSMVVAGALGSFIFGAYGVLWLYVTPLEHESLELRLLGMLACLGLWLSPRWPARCRKYLPWLWFATLCYALPFFSTYQLLASNYSLLRSMIEVATVFLIIGLFPNYMLASVNMALGLFLGTLAAYFTLPDFWALNHAIVKSVHLPVLLYSIVTGMILTRSHLKSLLAQEKVEAMKALIGSIAREMRSPLGQLTQRMDTMGRLLPDHVVGTKTQTINVSDLEALYTLIAKCKEAIERGRHVIEMTMDEISANPVSRSGYRHLSAFSVVNKAVEEFSFPSANEKARVSLWLNMDFVFNGNETRFIFTLFNLLKNSIYYFDEYPEARVTITVDRQTVTFEDTGPGMKPEVLSRVFEAFHSVDKPGGTGLGLSFCKRTMLAFGGDIVCESVPSQFTRFVMNFPRVPIGELLAHEAGVRKKAIAMFGGKRILIVDDSRQFRSTPKKVLTALGAFIDEVDDGSQALEMLATNQYEAMLLDLHMPILDGYATAEKVRSGAVPGQENLTIVAHSAESPHAAMVRLERIGVNEFVSKGCSPLELIDALCRAHALPKNGTKATAVSEKLAGKTILLADDEDFSRKYLRTVLLAMGFQVREACNGQAALSLLNDSSLQIDALVTDIHMPGMDGMEIARTLRSRALPQRTMPVIAMSARSDSDMITAAYEAGINDFIFKPVEPSVLFRKLNALLGGEMQKLNGEAVALQEASPAVHPLLDLARLDSLRQVGLLWHDFVQVLEEMQTQLDKLATHFEANELVQAKALMHTLVGLAAQMGAKAVHEEVQGRYDFMMATGQWPPEGDWLPQLRELFIDTKQLMKTHLKS